MEQFLQLPLSFTFETEKPVPIPEIVKSLEGLEKLSKYLPVLLSRVSGVHVEGVIFKVNKLESGSLKEFFDTCIVFLSAEEKEKFRVWLDTTSLGKTMKLGGLIALLVMGITTTALTAYNAFKGDAGIHISASNHSVVQIGAKALNITVDKFSEDLSVSVGQNKKDITRASAQFLAPSRIEGGGSLVFDSDNVQGLKIEHEAILDTPSVPDFSSVTVTTNHKNTKLSARLFNRDNLKSWKVTLPEILDDRKLKVVFDNDNVADILLHHLDVRADVEITYSQEYGSGALVPISVLIKKIH